MTTSIKRCWSCSSNIKARTGKVKTAVDCTACGGFVLRGIIYLYPPTALLRYVFLTENRAHYRGQVRTVSVTGDALLPPIAHLHPAQLSLRGSSQAASQSVSPVVGESAGLNYLSIPTHRPFKVCFPDGKQGVLTKLSRNCCLKKGLPRRSPDRLAMTAGCFSTQKSETELLSPISLFFLFLLLFLLSFLAKRKRKSRLTQTIFYPSMPHARSGR